MQKYIIFIIISHYQALYCSDIKKTDEIINNNSFFEPDETINFVIQFTPQKTEPKNTSSPSHIFNFLTKKIAEHNNKNFLIESNTNPSKKEEPIKAKKKLLNQPKKHKIIFKDKNNGQSNT